jgi:hypothetical protein
MRMNRAQNVEFFMGILVGGLEWDLKDVEIEPIAHAEMEGKRVNALELEKLDFSDVMVFSYYIFMLS